MAIKATKTREGLLLSGSVPQELEGEIELYHLKNGIYLLCPKGSIGNAASGAAQLPAATGGQSASLSAAEKELLRKMLAVRFEKRTPAQLEPLLSPDERKTLEGLRKKKLVDVFHSEKYKEGVYNISDFAFNAVREPPAQPPSQPQPSATLLSPSSAEHLDSQGWMVLEGEQDARNFALRFPEKIKSGEVRGVRAFDRKYYFVKKSLLSEFEKPVQLALSKSEKSPEEIASQVRLAPGACLALLINLCDEGEAMEKHRGKFTKA